MVTGAEGYRVGTDGSIWTLWVPRQKKLGTVWRQMKPYPDSGGYLQVEIAKDGRRRAFLLHRLILETFVGPCPEGLECLHADDVKANCAIGNISWGTRKKNMEDAAVRGRLPQRRLTAIGKGLLNYHFWHSNVKRQTTVDKA